MLRDNFRVQRRVLAALFLREMQSRWGRRNLGFAWLFAEPLVFAFPVLWVWSKIRAPIDNGLPMLPFLWSGYMGLLIFRHVTGRSLFIIRNNVAILYHPMVGPFDVFIGTCGMEAMGNIASVAVSFVVLYALGALPWPDNLPLMMAGFMYMTWWSLAIALLVAGLSERYEIVEHVWAVTSYVYLILCGFMFVASWLPLPLRNIALLVDPPLHCYEMIRQGLFGPSFPFYYDLPYLTIILATLTLAGLWQMHHIRRYIEIR